jgi:hypothetical protein
MTQIVNSVEFKTPEEIDEGDEDEIDEGDEGDEDETIDDGEDEIDEGDEDEIDEGDEDEDMDDDSDGWQNVDNKTIKYGDLCLTAENPRGSIVDGKFINNAAWTDGPHFYVTDESVDRM